MGAAAVLLLIALPFLVVSPAQVRGVPGPLLIVVSLAASFVLGPRWGVVLTCLGVALAVGVVGENRWSEPLVWIPTAVVVGILGDRVRRAEAVRLELLGQLRAGLVALSSSPTLGPFEVVARYAPAERAQLLAGDFYGVLAEPDGSVAVMVGDVAGHGPGAAAVATHLRAAWRALVSAGVPAREVVGVLNDTLRAEQAFGASKVAFATLLTGSLSADCRRACFVLAGHPPPILVTPSGASELQLVGGAPIGVRDGAAWEVQEIALPPAPWTLLSYTDGLVEGRTAPDGGRPFGVVKLMGALAQMGPSGAHDVDALLHLARAANGEAMADDIVVLALSPHR